MRQERIITQTPRFSIKSFDFRDLRYRKHFAVLLWSRQLVDRKWVQEYALMRRGVNREPASVYVKSIVISYELGYL